MFLSVFPDVYHAAFHWQGLVIVPQFQIMFTKLLIVIIAVVVWEAGMAQWWEHSPPTDVAWDRFLGSTQYVGWVCCWFSSLLQEVFLRVLQFFPLLKNQHFQILIQSRFQWTNSHSVEVPLQIPTVLLLFLSFFVLHCFLRRFQLQCLGYIGCFVRSIPEVVGIQVRIYTSLIYVVLVIGIALQYYCMTGWHIIIKLFTLKLVKV